VVLLAQKLLGYARDAIEHGRARETVVAASTQLRALRDDERETMRELISLTREMTWEEHRLLDRRREQALRAQAKTKTMVFLALGLALALVIGSTWATTTNIVRRKRAQESEDRLKQVVDLQAAREENARFHERFVGILGHDLRSPLTAISMGAGLLRRRALSDGESKTVERILASAERMSRMIGQLLDLTRSRHGGGISVESKPMDMAELTRRVVEELEMANPGRGIAIDVQGDTTGHWDPDRLEQVVSNLVGNAIQHGCADKPIEVRLRGGNHGVELVVRNAGHPIPTEVLPVIFDPFRRAKGSSPNGLGLGLFITRQIVLAHEGVIDVVSMAAGTTFTVKLPRRTDLLAANSDSPSAPSHPRLSMA
jgi:signal transduction histidine kinase